MSICIIPARSGSKRIKDKNIKLFFGKPLIYYSIKLALKTKLFKRVLVSTDSKKIAKVAKGYGAEVPFLRSKKNSNDKAPIHEVLKETIKNLGLKSQFVVCLYPTAPLLKALDLKRGLRKAKKNYDQVIAISKFQSPIQRAFRVYNKKYIKFINPKYKYYRSQDLENRYFDTGTFAIYKTNIIKNYIKKKNLKIGFIEIDKLSAIDINEKEDFEYAKMLFKLKKYVK